MMFHVDSDTLDQDCLQGNMANYLWLVTALKQVSSDQSPLYFRSPPPGYGQAQTAHGTKIGFAPAGACGGHPAGSTMTMMIMLRMFIIIAVMG